MSHTIAFAQREKYSAQYAKVIAQREKCFARYAEEIAQREKWIFEGNISISNPANLHSGTDSKNPVLRSQFSFFLKTTIFTKQKQFIIGKKTLEQVC